MDQLNHAMTGHESSIIEPAVELSEERGKTDHFTQNKGRVYHVMM